MPLRVANEPLIFRPRIRITSVPGARLGFDGLGAFYPPVLYYRDGTPVDRSAKGMGDIPDCCVGLRGLRGDVSAQTLALSATQIAGAGIAAIASTGSAAAPALLGLTAAAVPVIGAVVVGVTLAISLLWKVFSGDPRKNATTSIVNQIEPKLQENLAGYMAGPRTASSQAQALANFDAAWQLVLANCNRQEFGVAVGEPGYNCIHDRMQGACHWTKSGQTPGHPPDDCFNWFLGYRDPIAQDPNVKPDPGTEPETTAAGGVASGTANASADGTTGAPSNTLLLAGLLAGAAILVGMN